MHSGTGSVACGCCPRLLEQLAPGCDTLPRTNCPGGGRRRSQRSAWPGHDPVSCFPTLKKTPVREQSRRVTALGVHGGEEAFMARQARSEGVCGLGDKHLPCGNRLTERPRAAAVMGCAAQPGAASAGEGDHSTDRRGGRGDGGVFACS